MRFSSVSRRTMVLGSAMAIDSVISSPSSRGGRPLSASAAPPDAIHSDPFLPPAQEVAGGLFSFVLALRSGLRRKAG
jgi:hypothetical protein